MKFFGCITLALCAVTLGSMPAWADDESDCHSRTLPANQVGNACKRVTERYELETKIMGGYFQCAVFGWGINNFAHDIFDSCSALLQVEFVDPHTRAVWYKSRGDAYANAGDAKRAKADYDAAGRLDPGTK